MFKNSGTSRLLPPRGGSYPVNHSLTSFNHVMLPPSSLLDIVDINYQKITHPQFMTMIWRVAVGSLALGSISVPCIQLSTVIGIKYGQRRYVATTKHTNARSPLITISTHQKPTLTALAQAFVMKALAQQVIHLFKIECRTSQCD